MPAKKKGIEVRKPLSIREEPLVREAIEELYGSVSNFWSIKVNKDKKLREKIAELRGKK